MESGARSGIAMPGLPRGEIAMPTAQSIASSLKLPPSYSQIVTDAESLSMGISSGKLTASDLLARSNSWLALPSYSQYFTPTPEEPMPEWKPWVGTSTGEWSLGHTSSYS